MKLPKHINYQSKNNSTYVTLFTLPYFKTDEVVKNKKLTRLLPQSSTEPSSMSKPKLY